MEGPIDLERKGSESIGFRPTLWLWTVPSTMTLSLNLKVKFWKSRNSGMGCPIDMEWKGYGPAECWTRTVTFNFELTHHLDLELSTSNFETVVSQQWEGRHGTKAIWVQRLLYLLCDLELWPWSWIFKVKFWKCCISGMGGPIDMEPKGFESIGC